jgi:hypothetical protein
MSIRYNLKNGKQFEYVVSIENTANLNAVLINEIL